MQLAEVYNSLDPNHYVLIKDYEVVTTSVGIATIFSKKHSTIIKYIHELFNTFFLLRDSQLLKALQCFTYKDYNNNVFEAYYVNRYGLDLINCSIVHKNKLKLWKKYIEAFENKQRFLDFTIKCMSKIEQLDVNSLLSVKEIQTQQQYNRVWHNT